MLKAAIAISMVQGLAVSLAWAERVVPVSARVQSGAGLTVVVRDDAGPIAGAQVWVESGEGRLLATGTCGSDGVFAVAELDALPVDITAAAPDHGAVSMLRNTVRRIELELPRPLALRYSILQGTLTGFAQDDDGGKAVAGAVAKALEPMDLTRLDPSMLVSPLKDTIDVFGARSIPSNLVIPDQTVPIYFIPIHLSKPSYRLPALGGTSARYFGIGGAVPAQDALNAVRGRNPWQAINLMEVSRIGLSKAVDVPAAGGTEIPLAIEADRVIGGVARLRAGRNTTPDGTKRIVAGVWEPEPGLYVPTDAKLAEDGAELSVRVVDGISEGVSARLLDAIFNTGGDHFRGAWVEPSAGILPDAGLKASLSLAGIDRAWEISGAEDAELVVGHAEFQRSTSLGGSRFEDRWIVVSLRAERFRLPPSAYRELAGGLGRISHASVDLMRFRHRGYPRGDGEVLGESFADDLAVLEKIRISLPR